MIERESLKLSDYGDPALHRRLTDGSLDVLVLLSPDFRRLYVSPACEEVMGYSPSELLGGRADSLVHEADLERVTSTMAGLCEAAPVAQAAWRMRRRDSTYRWMETRYRRLPDGHVVTGIRDIQDRKETEAQLQAALGRVQRLAMLDQLTGMPNRRWFMEQVEKRLPETEAGPGQALMIVDLDGFKAINDRYGHPVGDSVLIEVGRRLEAVMSGHVVARLGGDEFAILARMDGPEDTRLAAEHVVAAVTAPVQYGPRALETGVSIGIALFPQDGRNYRVLMTHADVAMYTVKRASTKDRFRFYSPAMNDRVQRAADLERALSGGEIVPYFQPLVSLDHGRIVAFEALARWIHPVDGLLTPDRFLPLVEECGLHDELFTAIMRQAGRNAAAWPATVRLCVNVSPVQLSDRAFPAHVAALLSERPFRNQGGTSTARGWMAVPDVIPGRCSKLAGDLMWTPTTRAQHSRAGLRYGSDLTDAEWLILSPFLPPPRSCGCPRKWEMREIINAIFYVLRGGIAWSLLPKDFPPWSTAYRWFAQFRDDGTWERINHHLVMLDHERVGREASPTAAVIDSQSVKTTESGGIRGYDAGKKIKGRKRHAMVDTDGRALKLQAHAASIQDRDGAGPLLRASRPSWPFVALCYADGGYAGARVAEASPIRIEVVRKANNQVGFAVIARRWVVERFFAWINRNRRLAKDFEATIESVEAFLYAAATVLLLRRLAR